MKNSRKYSIDIKNRVINDYKYSYIGCNKLSLIYNIPKQTISRWVYGVKKVFHTQNLNTAKLIESIVVGKIYYLYHNYNNDEIKAAMNKYLGKNEKNIVGLKSKV